MNQDTDALCYINIILNLYWLWNTKHVTLVARRLMHTQLSTVVLDMVHCE